MNKYFTIFNYVVLFSSAVNNSNLQETCKSDNKCKSESSDSDNDQNENSDCGKYIIMTYFTQNNLYCSV